MGGAGYGNHGEEADPKGGPASGGDAGESRGGGPHPAGPHADESLTDPELTPGAGTLPGPRSEGGDVDTADA